MKKIRVEDSIGQVLAHDLTKIVPGQFKGRRFKKGHIIRPEDVPELLQMGKEHLYVLELGPDDIHEDEAALRLARAALAVGNHGIELTEPKEGKVSLVARRAGLLKVNLPALQEVNQVGEVILATLHNNYPVREGQVVAGTRLIPLVTKRDVIERIEGICREAEGILKVVAYRPMRAGLITTGSEVYKGRIKDAFGPVVRAKVAQYGSQVVEERIVPDDAEIISRSILEMAGHKLDLILLTGGMSVDPDDVTPAGIRMSGAEVITYGAPVLPGAMFMLAYLDNIPLVGLPGCVMYYRATIFDLVLARILTGERLTRGDIAGMAAGGLCLECSECRYPACPFGKGGYYPSR
ncbi:MAG: molybdopterin-binding protein [Thermoanaerobacteraceae bacterium]|uniref:molybdopterin-binding protein n=1 Tax=Thermanaeromonas sp. C210 TaxID=2731925 RepID=UPI00155B7F7C|nr:molybdopterin-binding protein [Thermanaeromonas sp. C210]MBE3580741.1 molybdopterin-binding protein [Thermoanaerobacteraceae bacterium]GFN23992.1 molybdopterin-binding protein [Thermanaeromonas sp. C210]